MISVPYRADRKLLLGQDLMNRLKRVSAKSIVTLTKTVPPPKPAPLHRQRSERASLLSRGKQSAPFASRFIRCNERFAGQRINRLPASDSFEQPANPVQANSMNPQRINESSASKRTANRVHESSAICESIANKRIVSEYSHRESSKRANRV